MKKLILSLATIGLLSVASHAAECKLILEPSDFQLDTNLRAPNETYAFSVIGNFYYRSNFLGFANATFCGYLTNRDVDKRRSCMKEFDAFVEEDSAKITGNTLSDALGKNAADGYKSSPKAPITKKHLCLLQNKYKTKTTIPASTILELIQQRQEEMQQNYIKAAEIAGQSNNPNEIVNLISQIENHK